MEKPSKIDWKEFFIPSGGKLGTIVIFIFIFVVISGFVALLSFGSGPSDFGSAPFFIFVATIFGALSPFLLFWSFGWILNIIYFYIIIAGIIYAIHHPEKRKIIIITGLFLIVIIPFIRSIVFYFLIDYYNQNFHVFVGWILNPIYYYIILAGVVYAISHPNKRKFLAVVASIILVFSLIGAVVYWDWGYEREINRQRELELKRLDPDKYQICWICYDGVKNCEKYPVLSPIEIGKPDAEIFCKDKCSSDKTKCGIETIYIDKN